MSPRRPCLGGSACGVRVAERHDTEPVAAPRREMPDGDRHPFGDVGLAAIRRPELHRGRDVEHEPGDEHALGERDANVRLVRPRRHVPVDAADVVTGDVRANERELGAFAEKRRPIVAGQQTLDAAPDAHVESTQERPRHRPRAGTGRGGRRGYDGLREAHAALDLARSICGTGTAASTCSRMVSGLTSSASAWYVSTSRCRKASRASSLDVLGERVFATTEKREGPRRLDDADRPPRAGAVGDVGRDLGEPVRRRLPRRRREGDRVAHERRVDVDLVTARCIAFRSSRVSASRSSGCSTSWRWTTVSSSSCFG